MACHRMHRASRVGKPTSSFVSDDDGVPSRMLAETPSSSSLVYVAGGPPRGPMPDATTHDRRG